MVIKAYERRTSCPCHDEFRGPRSDYVRQRHDSSGRPKAKADREDILIVRLAATAFDSSLSTIRCKTRTRVSTMTIHRRLIQRHLRSYRPLRHLLFTLAHCGVRLQWCLNQSGWNHAHWRRIVFNDELLLQLCPDDPRKGDGYGSMPIRLSLLHATQTLNKELWSGVPFFLSRTHLTIIRGTLTAHRYVDDILRNVLLALLLHYSGLIFQQDNAKPYTTRIAMNYLKAYQILPRPSRLPDPSPIKPIWDMMGGRLHLSENVDDLALQLEKFCQEVTQETIRAIYQSMSRHVTACVQARGGSTPY
ncbi:transposable element Tc1 transposase [Trichonephila clavipes]|nr:transposable element Tc1 transposase [Trichonephila clavipes]